MASFTPRLDSSGIENDFHWYSDNPFYQAGYGLPNCTCYAWGRFWEISDPNGDGSNRPTLPTGDAGTWYPNVTGYQKGQTPKLGSVICWSYPEGSGHVAIVEQILSNGDIVTSNSAWNSTFFYTKTIYKSDGYNFGNYVFQGFIYNPTVESSSTVEWPEPISGNRYLTRSEMENNATYIYYYLSQKGWTINAIAGLLGNMETESTINPGIWENFDTTQPDTLGRGLVGWTPANRVNTWAEARGLDPGAMDTQLKMLLWEVKNGGVYYPTDSYPTPATFADFTKSTESPNYLGMAFLYNYERPYVQYQPARGEQAEVWYEFLLTLGPAPSIPSSGKRRKRKFNFILYNKQRRWNV